MKKAENTGNYIDISFSNKRNNVFLLLLYKSYYLNLVTFAVAPLAGAWVEIYVWVDGECTDEVAPLAGAWVEITDDDENACNTLVAPLAGAWVEIIFSNSLSDSLSLPSRERGLKFKINSFGRCQTWSLPSRERGLKYKTSVALSVKKASLPSRERGLK